MTHLAPLASESKKGRATFLLWCSAGTWHTLRGLWITPNVHIVFKLSKTLSNCSIGEILCTAWKKKTDAEKPWSDCFHTGYCLNTGAVSLFHCGSILDTVLWVCFVWHIMHMDSCATLGSRQTARFAFWSASQPGNQDDIFFYSSLHQDIVCNVTIHCMLMEEKVVELLHLQHATKKVCTGDIWTQFFSLIKASVWVKEWLQICACLKVKPGHRKNKIAQQDVLVGFQPKI